jgi:hypothetical protein
MQAYKITVHNLLNNRFKPTVIPAHNLVHMGWRSWQIARALMQTYDIIPGSKFGIIDRKIHDSESEKNNMMYGWDDGKTITPVVMIELDFAE